MTNYGLVTISTIADLISAGLVSCEVKLVDFGSLKALVSVKVCGMEIRGFKVIDQNKGETWVSMPSREITRDGKKEYFDVVRFADDDSRKAFCKFVLKCYRDSK